MLPSHKIDSGGEAPSLRLRMPTETERKLRSTNKGVSQSFRSGSEHISRDFTGLPADGCLAARCPGGHLGVPYDGTSRRFDDGSGTNRSSLQPPYLLPRARRGGLLRRRSLALAAVFDSRFQATEREKTVQK